MFSATKAKIIFFILSVGFSISAQTIPSIMQTESRYYSSHPILKSESYNNSLILHKERTAKTKLSKTVFGFLPWWEYQSGDYASIQFNLLTHIAIFSFEADSLGTLNRPVGWPWIDVINKANSDGIKLIATITNFDSKSIHRILTDIGIQKELFNNIRSVLMSYGLSGLTIDFENIPDADLQFAVKNFLSALRSYLVQINPSVNYEISFATPAVGFGKWNFSSLLETCDYLFIMGYDYYGSWSSTTGPSSPLTGTYYNLTKSLTEDYGSIDPSKLILGVPYYGNYWKTNSPNPYNSVSVYDSTKQNNNWQKAIYYKDIFSTYAQKEKLRDNISQTPWLRWQDTTWNQIWYDDSLSLAAKFDLTIQKNLKGIGIWALGYDNGRNELWELIRNKFANTTLVNDQVKPTEFVLNQNYPNPFNPSTIISWRLVAGSWVTLKVYDLLGRELATLVNEYEQPGIYNSKFTIHNSQLESGVYFYRLSVGSYSQTKKMVIMK